MSGIPTYKEAEEMNRRGYFDSLWYSSLQAKIAVASFASGVILASICLFWIEPKGEISSSAISIVSELLILSGALLGVMVNFDIKQQAFASQIAEQLAKKKDKEGTETHSN